LRCSAPPPSRHDDRNRARHHRCTSRVALAVGYNGRDGRLERAVAARSTAVEGLISCHTPGTSENGSGDDDDAIARADQLKARVVGMQGCWIAVG
jgi:hypothetical protein